MEAIWYPGLKLADVEKVVILKAIAHFRGNKTQASLALGISAKTIDNKLKEYESTAKIQEDSEKEALELEETRRREFALAQKYGWGKVPATDQIKMPDIAVEMYKKKESEYQQRATEIEKEEKQKKVKS